jgi:hypothetical protein
VSNGLFFFLVVLGVVTAIAANVIVSHRPQPQQSQAIVGMRDDANGVICYWYAGAMSCVKVKP